MDIIRNYIDTMFQVYPKTSQTERMKKDLMDMAEKKYHDCIREGHNQNEAIGIIIADLEKMEEEVKKNIPNDGEDQYSDSYKKKDSVRNIGYREAVEYMQDMEKISTKIGLGVWLCIASPAILLFFLDLKEKNSMPTMVAVALGISLMTVCVAAGIALFIYSGIRIQRYHLWKTEIFHLDVSTKQYVENMREAFRPTYTANLIAGIVICIISIIPIVAGMALDMILFGIGVSAVLLGLGVYFFICAGMRQSCYRVILQEKEYTEEKKKMPWRKYEDTYWIMVTVIYFLVSFWTRKWGMTWIIWVLAAGINNIMNGIMKK